MKYRILLLTSLLIAALFVVIGVTPPNVSVLPVLVNSTNKTVEFPTNFWTANSNLLNGVVNSALVDIDYVAGASNGLISRIAGSNYVNSTQLANGTNSVKNWVGSQGYVTSSITNGFAGTNQIYRVIPGSGMTASTNGWSVTLNNPTSGGDVYLANSQVFSGTNTMTKPLYGSFASITNLNIGGGNNLFHLGNGNAWAISDAEGNLYDIGAYDANGKRYFWTEADTEFWAPVWITDEAEVERGKLLYVDANGKLTNSAIDFDAAIGGLTGTNYGLFSITNDAAGLKLVGDMTTMDGQSSYTPRYYGWNSSGVKTWYPYGSTIYLNGESPVTYSTFDYRIGTGLTVAKSAWTFPAVGMYFDWSVDTNTIASRLWSASQYLPLAGGQLAGGLTFASSGGLRLPPTNSLAAADGAIWYGADGRLWWRDNVNGDVVRRAMYVGEAGNVYLASNNVFTASNRFNGPVNIASAANPFVVNTNWLVAANGRVGIGTNNPDATLHLLGTFSLGDAVASRINMEFIGGLSRITTAASLGWSLEATHSSAPPIVFKTGFPSLTNRLVITGTGDVGIGTNTPAQKLDVLGSIRHLGMIGVGTSLGDQHWLDNTPSKATRRSIDASGDMLLGMYDGSVWHTALTINNATRNVGIGTNTPAQKLDVLGSIRHLGMIGVGPSLGDQHWLDNTPSKATRRSIGASGDMLLGMYDGSVWHTALTINNATRAVRIGTNNVVFAPEQQTNWLGGLTRMNNVLVNGTFTLNSTPQTPGAADKVVFSVNPDGNVILSDLAYSNVATKTWVVDQGYGTGGTGTSGFSTNMAHHEKLTIAYSDNDFYSTTSENGWSIGSSGGSVGNSTDTVTNRPGIVNLLTGSSATAHSFTGGNNASAVAFGGGECASEFIVKSPNELSTVAETYEIRVGFNDTATGAATDGAYFQYTTNNANWVAVVARNGTRTTNNTGLVFAVNTWYRLGVHVNANASTVTFYANGVIATTISDNNIPTSAELTRPYAVIQKINGTTSRSLHVDYARFWKVISR